MKIIEFSGMPNSGKTTLLKKLCSDMSRGGRSCKIITDGVRNSPIKPKGGFKYNLWGIIKEAESILSESNAKTRFYFS